MVAALCQRAFPQTAHTLILPCESNPVDLEDARLVARSLNLEPVTIPLDGPYEALRRVLPEEGAPDRRRMALANLKPRLRMIALYYYANTHNLLVVGTGNRSELHVGYFTKYGDGGVDILPLAGLVKSEVRELARHLGIPERIITKPPTAGLWAGQTDEGEMGLTYADLDRYLLTGEAEPAVRDCIVRMHEASEHKRRMPAQPPLPPPGPGARRSGA